jgi:hypothetical protein
MSSDSKMFFDTRNNYVSPSVIRKRIRENMNKPEYQAAIKRLSREYQAAKEEKRSK